LSGPEQIREYSLLGVEPYVIVRVADGQALVKDLVNGEEFELAVEDPASFLREFIPRIPPIQGLRFVGGAVGYVSFDCVRYWEKIPDEKPKVVDFPDMEFALYSDVIVIDHRMNEAYYFSLRGCETYPIKVEADLKPVIVKEVKCNMSKTGFEKMVSHAKEYIDAGDVFQVVLSKRYDVSLEGDLLSFYSNLRRLNPSPYMFFLKMGKRVLAGTSPEMLFRVDGGYVETFPIAGTRPITGVESDDSKLASEMVNDVKEVAEHIMLVDLARNDLGRVCRYGTISVKSLMEIHRFSHVQHMVSHVRGELQIGRDCYDVLRATFPAGTVTGAPKIRAMEIIEELEPEKRGPYAGCVGYFSYNGCADFAITIRTLTFDGEKASIQSGAGVVADSIPEREWFETENKAAALLAALKQDDAT